MLRGETEYYCFSLSVNIYFHFDLLVSDLTIPTTKNLPWVFCYAFAHKASHVRVLWFAYKDFFIRRGSTGHLPCSCLGFLHFINVKGLPSLLLLCFDFCATGIHVFCIHMIHTDVNGPLKILGVILNNLSPFLVPENKLLFSCYKRGTAF